MSRSSSAMSPAGTAPVRVWPQLLRLLVLLAFAVRALVPAGYMPGLDDRGMLSMVICSDQGAKTIQIDAAGRAVEPSTPDEHKAPSGKMQAPCGYALTALFGGVAPPIMPALPSIVFVLADYVLSAIARPQARYVAIFAPRGPPFLS